MTIAIIGTAAQEAPFVEAHRGLALNQLADLRKAYRKHINWLIAVQTYMANGQQGRPEAPMPSKDAKHQMYDMANWMIRHLVPQMPRPTNLEMIGAILLAAEIKLAGLDPDKQ